MARDRRMPPAARILSRVMMWGGIALGSWATQERAVALPGMLAMCGLSGTAVALSLLRHDETKVEGSRFGPGESSGRNHGHTHGNAFVTTEVRITDVDYAQEDLTGRTTGSRD
jgi:hypothetical protein